jgi:hypothetical protein
MQTMQSSVVIWPDWVKKTFRRAHTLMSQLPPFSASTAHSHKVAMKPHAHEKLEPLSYLYLFVAGDFAGQRLQQGIAFVL